MTFLVEEAEDSLDYHFESFYRYTEKVTVKLVFFNDIKNWLQ